MSRGLKVSSTTTWTDRCSLIWLYSIYTSNIRERCFFFGCDGNKKVKQSKKRKKNLVNQHLRLKADVSKHGGMTSGQGSQVVEERDEEKLDLVLFVEDGGVVSPV